MLALHLAQNARVLFIGDSVTDCGRSQNDDSSLGSGYAGLIAAWYSALAPHACVTFYNRGTSGHRVKDLRARWDRDVIALKPDVLSILIGINDTWRRFDSNDPTGADAFERDYRAILDRTRSHLKAQIILCEPFVLPLPPDRATWRTDLDPKIQVVRKLAVEYGAALLPLDGLFAQAAAQREPGFWLPDGVHPSPAGHALISQAWLRAAGVMI